MHHKIKALKTDIYDFLDRSPDTKSLRIHYVQQANRYIVELEQILRTPGIGEDLMRDLRYNEMYYLIKKVEWYGDLIDEEETNKSQITYSSWKIFILGLSLGFI